MFHRDTFRLIKKTRKRFITILLIVLIGVAFMVGLMSSAPTMRVSVDKYMDRSDFMDLQLYSSYGFDDRDVDALKKSDLIAGIYPTKFTDAFTQQGESQIVTRVQELDSTVNRIELAEGRMPRAENEALALGSSSFGSVFSIGDTVSLYLEDSELSETLSVTEYEIVGIARTPQYMASSKETSNLNNLTLDTVIFVDRDNFTADYYTSIYISLKGAAEYTAFSDDYKDYVTECADDLDKIISKQEVVRKEEIIEEITRQVAEGEKELEEKIGRAQAELDSGRQQLEDAYIQILVGEAQITANESQITSGEQEIAANEALLASAESQIAAGKRQITAQTGRSYEEAVTLVNLAYNIYNIADAIVGNSSTDSTLQEMIDRKKAEINTLGQENLQLTGENTTLEMEKAAVTAENTVLTETNNVLTQMNATLQAENDSLAAANVQLETEGKTEEIIANNLKIAENSLTIEANKATIASNDIKIAANNTKIAENDAKIAANNEKIVANNTQIGTLTEELGDLEMIIGMLGNVALGSIKDSINRMFGGDIKGVYASLQQLQRAEAQLNSGRQQIASARAELEAGKIRLASAKTELATGRAEYEKGMAELEKGQKQLDEEYEKARIELDKAKQQLDELPDAQWIVLDRTSHFSSYMFENNADQMSKIGYVFPVLFFLVAALVCMTTMKRLVDEERSQIGVFSALGFSKIKIASKYIIYALTASLAGSVVAIPVGMAIFPTVIYFCWKLMYDLPDMVLTMPAHIAVLGVCSFTLLMAMVTFIVVRGVLKENPSRLMRPKAPKTAKKIFLEHITPLWKRMSFTSKVTARNIIRYKSRFFMTVIGVAGCTSLLVLGFAIKDSVSQVVSIQYGDIITYDTTVTLESHEDMDSVLEKLKADKDVLYAVPHMTYSSMAYTEADEKAINVYVMEEDEIAGIIDLRQRRNGQPLTIEDGAVISEKFSKLCGVSVGDDITIESANGIKKQVEVTGICEMYTQHYLFISRENYEDIFNETVRYDSIALTSGEGAQLTEKYKDTPGVKNIVDFSGMKATFSNMFDSLNIIIVVIILAAGSLALVVIMNLTEVNISERIREIATLKVLGFNNGEVYSYIFKEVFILSLIGIIIGLPFGKLELIFVMDIIDMEMVMFSTAVQPSSYIFGFLITLAFTVLVILLMRKTLRNVQMVESLKSVE
ncbi:MAG: ABC transporter permease [Oscillospiraceae bacterium]|nr:ABC transporter permease [Oscillospiraceae bacterium]